MIHVRTQTCQEIVIGWTKFVQILIKIRKVYQSLSKKIERIWYKDLSLLIICFIFWNLQAFLLFLERRKYAIGTVEKIEIYLGFKKDYKSKYHSRSPFFFTQTLMQQAKPCILYIKSWEESMK